MKRLLTALLLSGAIANTPAILAQSSTTTPSRITISTGIGLFPTYYKANESKGMLPLSFMLGYDISKNFGVTGFFGYSSTQGNPTEFADGSNSYIINKTKVFGLRAEVHKELSERVTAYGGSMFGIHHADVTEYNTTTRLLVARSENQPTPFDPEAKKGKFTYAAFIGATVKIAKRVGIYGELGYGISIANLGVTVRI